jgi:hypothetical protein
MSQIGAIFAFAGIIYPHPITAAAAQTINWAVARDSVRRSRRRKDWQNCRIHAIVENANQTNA